MRLRRHDLHILSGSYALDALEAGAEQDRFARHLRRCQACAAEVAGLREVATSLALAGTAEPPPAMRASVLAAAARTRQVPPETRHYRLRGRGLTPRLAVGIAAAATAAAVVLGIAQVAAVRQLSRARAQDQAVAAVLTAPDARVLSSPTSDGGLTTVVVSAARRELVVSTAGLPRLGGGKVYELWLIGPPRTRPAGLLPAATAGVTGPVLATGLVAGDRLGITVEPPGGTATPTTAPILLLRLPAGA
jgi:anti-sigma-K factor RskA